MEGVTNNTLPNSFELKDNSTTLVKFCVINFNVCQEGAQLQLLNVSSWKDMTVSIKVSTGKWSSNFLPS